MSRPSWARRTILSLCLMIWARVKPSNTIFENKPSFAWSRSSAHNTNRLHQMALYATLHCQYIRYTCTAIYTLWIMCQWNMDACLPSDILSVALRSGCSCTICLFSCATCQSYPNCTLAKNPPYVIFHGHTKHPYKNGFLFCKTGREIFHGKRLGRPGVKKCWLRATKGLSDTM